MANTPELYWKVRIEQAGKPDRFEFITRETASARGLIAQVLSHGETSAYVKIGPQNYEPYETWKKRQKR
jgi:hypothetical protein